MLSLRTNQGMTFPIEWIGISEFDGSLRFEISQGDMAALFSVFTDPKHTQVLTRIFDETEKTYTGYTFFKGMDWLPTGGVVIRLLQG